MGTARLPPMLAIVHIIVALVGALPIASSHHSTVIIIGAGMTGIRLGEVLSAGGITDLLILEATDRVGGRVKSASLGGFPIELGANWVEGVNPELPSSKQLNPVWHLAEKVKLGRHLSDFDPLPQNWYNGSGKVPLAEIEDRFNYYWNDFYDKIDAQGQKLIDEGRADMSVLATEKVNGWLPSSPRDLAIDAWISEFEFAEPPSVTSTKHTFPLPTFEIYGPDIHLVVDKRGYVEVVHEVASKYLKMKRDWRTGGRLVDDKRLMLNSPVANVSYSKKGCKVVTKSGEKYTAEFCVVTASVGVLQARSIEFQPPLPDWKMERIEKFSMTVYMKIFLQFPFSFWPVGPGTEYFSYEDGRRGYYTVWEHLDNYLPDSHIVFVTIFDLEARRVARQPRADTQAEIMEVLRKMFPDKKVPDPIGFYLEDWEQNEYFRGTFSNWPIGFTDFDFELMKAPLGRLYFGGEATSRDFSGYVHGAYDSGKEVAKQILACKADKHKCPNSLSKIPKVVLTPGEGGDCQQTCRN